MRQFRATATTGANAMVTSTNQPIFSVSSLLRNSAYKHATFAALSIGIACSTHNVSAAIQFSDATDGAGFIRPAKVPGDPTIGGESYGAAWGDLNSDGYPDLFANNHRGLVSLYLNMGNGKFIDVSRQTRAWVFKPYADTHGGTWADFDNDGDQDLFVSLGRNPIETVQHFLVNQRGNLVNMTAEYNIQATNWGGRTPIWFDGNFDGRMDFMMAMYGHVGEVMQQQPSGLFTNVTKVNNFKCFKYHYGQLIDLTGEGRLDLLCSGEDIFPIAAYNTAVQPYTNITTRIPSVDKVADTIMADLDNNLRKDVFYLRGTLRPSSVTQHDSRTIEALLQGGIKGFDFKTTGNVTIKLDWNQSDEGVGRAPIKIGKKNTVFIDSGSSFTMDPNDPDVVGQPVSAESEYPVIHIWYEPALNLWHFSHLNGKVVGTTGAGFSSGYFITTSDSNITEVKSKGIWSTEKPIPSVALMNYSSGPTGWKDETVAKNLHAPVQCVSGVAGDFDNDMDQDIYLACRNGSANLPNILFENQGAAGFVKVANAGGAAGPVGASVSAKVVVNGAQVPVGTADSVVTADYNADGFLDLFVTNGFNMRPVNHGGPDLLFRNQGNGNHWLEIDLEGAGTSTRDAVGARVVVKANGVSQLREQDFGFHRWSQNHKRLHFGLASATKADLDVTWPNGATETFTEVNADRIIRIRQGVGISEVTPGNALPYPCGLPTYSGVQDKALIIWKDCVSDVNTWRLRFVAGGSPTEITYQGSLFSSNAITSVAKVTTEASDTATLDGTSKNLTFSMTTNNSNSDGLNIVFPYGGNTCFNVNLPAGAQILFGRFRTPVTPPFNLETMQPCTP